MNEGNLRVSISIRISIICISITSNSICPRRKGRQDQREIDEKYLCDYLILNFKLPINPFNVLPIYSMADLYKMVIFKMKFCIGQCAKVFVIFLPITKRVSLNP